MLARVVQYLRSHNVPFRLSSYPSHEPFPPIAYRVPPGGVMVETCLLLVAGRPAVACMPRGAKVDFPALETELGAVALAGTAQDLPAPYTGVEGPFPPLGGALGTTLTILDQSLVTASSVAFSAFSRNDILEIPFDAFSRLERPRICFFALGGELPERSAAGELGPMGEPERKSA